MSLVSVPMGSESTPIFRRVGSRRLSEEVSSQIRGAIADGTLSPGDKLPAERELAAQFGISRTAVREALRSLEYAGLISPRKGVHGGSFVTSSEMSLVQSFRSMFELGQLSFSELTAARIEVQTVIIRLAAKNATAEDFAALREDIEKTNQTLEAHGSDVRDMGISQDFYAVLAMSTGNRVLEMIVRALSHMVYEAIQKASPVFDFDVVEVRTRFVDNLEQGNVDAAIEIMTDYLNFLHEHFSNVARRKGVRLD